MKTFLPLFMKNPEWYYHDEKEFCYKLTDKAPKEAVVSYIDFFKNSHGGAYLLLELGYISQEKFNREYEEMQKQNE